jgi:hypothetical protein
MISDEQIRELAYQIWQQEGCPEGKATEHYFRAKQILEKEPFAPATSELKQLPPSVEPPKLTSISKQKPYNSRKNRLK